VLTSDRFVDLALAEFVPSLASKAVEDGARLEWPVHELDLCEQVTDRCRKPSMTSSGSDASMILSAVAAAL
jgi:hypothetical protein